MVIAVGADVPQGGVQVVAKAKAADAQISEGGVIAIYNIPAQNLATSYAGVNVVVRQAASVEVSEAGLFAIARGQIANPRVRAWTFTLDSHDFYVLRLGDIETLVYDVTTDQWFDWSSGAEAFWRLNTGITWIGGQSLAYDYGSNIIAGDDTWGLLWFLDPDRPYDENPDYLHVTQQLEFSRIVTGQFPLHGRQVMPCYAIFLGGDNYGLTVSDFTPGVTLEYSDDAGQNYNDAGTINITLSPVDQVYHWLSLGQISAPGRIFKITDNGIFARIDNMNMNDDAG